MRSLFILMVLACSTLIRPSGASADVSATGECFTVLDVTNEAVSCDVAINTVKVSYGTLVSYRADDIIAPDYAANEQCLECDAALMVSIDDLDENGQFLPERPDSWRSMKSDFTKLKPNHLMFRSPRDGLIRPWGLTNTSTRGGLEPIRRI